MRSKVRLSKVKLKAITLCYKFLTDFQMFNFCKRRSMQNRKLLHVIYLILQTKLLLWQK